jgi:bacillithiol system protein YtxJ
MIELTSQEEWQNTLAKAKEDGKKVFLAKLSPACPVSHSAEAVIVDWLSQHPQTDFIALRVDVIRARNLARGIGQDLGIKHESPQVICLDQEGAPLWDADHFAITQDLLNDKLPQ